MADRGRLFYDSNGKLRQVDPAFVINGEPTESDLEPVEFVAVTTDQATINESGAKISKDNDQSGLASGSEHTVSYDTVEYEEPDVADADLTSDSITVQVAGRYIATASAQWEHGDGTLTELRIKKNGSTAIENVIYAQSVTFQKMNVFFIGDLAVNDTITVTAEQTSGSNQTLNANGMLAIQRVA